MNATDPISSTKPTFALLTALLLAPLVALAGDRNSVPPGTRSLRPVVRRFAATLILAGSFLGANAAERGFTVAEDDSRWQIIAPSGKAVFLIGMNHLNDGSPADVGRRAYLDVADQRLRDWGLNNLGYGAPAELRGQMPFLLETRFTTGSQFDEAGKFRYVDVFDAAFQTEVRRKVREVCAASRDHPNLIGYYWTDTPRWDITLARRLRGDDWVSTLRRLPSTAAGKRAYVDFLRERYDNDPARFTRAYGHAIASFDDLLLYDFREFDRDTPAGQADDRAFLGRIAAELYRVTGEAYRAHAPGRLIFGERYKLRDHPDEVLREAAKWIDVLSIQPGPSVGPRPGPGTDESEFDRAEFDRLHQLTGKPILICDHRLSYRRPEFPVTLWHQFATEQEAFDATRRFTLAAAARPYVIGYQHCQYRDSFSPERGNMLKPGLVRADGTVGAVFDVGLPGLNKELAETHARSR